MEETTVTVTEEQQAQQAKATRKLGPKSWANSLRAHMEGAAKYIKLLAEEEGVRVQIHAMFDEGESSVLDSNGFDTSDYFQGFHVGVTKQAREEQL